MGTARVPPHRLTQKMPPIVQKACEVRDGPRVPKPEGCFVKVPGFLGSLKIIKIKIKKASGHWEPIFIAKALISVWAEVSLNWPINRIWANFPMSSRHVSFEAAGGAVRVLHEHQPAHDARARTPPRPTQADRAAAERGSPPR